MCPRCGDPKHCITFGQGAAHLRTRAPTPKAMPRSVTPGHSGAKPSAQRAMPLILDNMKTAQGAGRAEGSPRGAWTEQMHVMVKYRR